MSDRNKWEQQIDMATKELTKVMDAYMVYVLGEHIKSELTDDEHCEWVNDTNSLDRINAVAEALKDMT